MSQEPESAESGGESVYQLEESPGDWFGDHLWVMDFEGSVRTSVVEAGVVGMSRAGEVRAWTACFGAEARLSWEDIRTHGLRERDLVGREPFRGEFERFRGYRECGLLGAHHAVVEQRLLRAVWPMPGWMPDPRSPGSPVAEWGPWIDSLRLARKVYPGLADYKLEVLVVWAGLQEMLDEWAARVCPPGRRRYHCALYDALASWLLLLRMARDHGWADWSADRLLRWQDSPVAEGGGEQLDLFG